MKKSLQHLVFGSLFAAILVAGSAAHAQTTETPKPKRDWYPFYGTVAAVDKSAKTVALKKKEGERVLHTDAQTTLEMGGKPATLSSIQPGYYLHGKLHKENSVEYILDAKIELEAPAKKGTNHVAAVTAPVVAPAANTDGTSTNAVTKAKKKKKKAANTDTNAPAANQ